ncbi:hypothetical protein AB0N93_24690 [Streptomyces sp. NPDC091267]|uniref:hypothetical protein n=1 Tax=unclassified Streptomyces TaxID=2593676 RepID=UPI003421B4A0
MTSAPAVAPAGPAAVCAAALEHRVALLPGQGGSHAHPRRLRRVPVGGGISLGTDGRHPVLTGLVEVPAPGSAVSCASAAA